MSRVTGAAAGMVRNGTAGNDEIDGGAGNDRLFGLGGNDEIDGGAGNDLIDGGEGADDLDGELGDDSLSGGVGNDLLNGGAGNDLLTGGAGADVFEFYRGSGRDVITDFANGQDRIEIDGLSRTGAEALISAAQQVGNDVVLTLAADRSITLQAFRLSDLDLSDFRDLESGPGTVRPPVTPPNGPVPGREIDGTNGADVLIGTAGNDDMDGRRGNDQLRGGAGNDDMDGDDGNDSLLGEDGRDDIDGGRGNDVLDGGAGNDTLVGGRGNDLLTGGAGADIFEFRRGDGNDRITDFTNGVDRIELDGFSARALTDILNGARQVGSDVVLSLPSNASITLADMQLSQLDRSDFLL
ncbi:MAG: calcium-binding protein [Rhodobacteraceae bacterium]|nr:calcium-binding protein [Paracoccaceae bacterium]